MAASLIGMTLPSWASHLEYKLAPPPLLLVQAFVNTLDLDLRTDVLAHADEARAWLAEAGLRDPGPGSPVQADPDFAADLQLGPGLARDLLERPQLGFGKRLAVGVVRDHGAQAPPDVAG